MYFELWSVPFQKWSLFGSLAVKGLQRLWEEVVSCRGSSPAGWCRGLGITPPKTNMEPQNRGLEDDFGFQRSDFSLVSMLIFSGVFLVLFCNDQDWNHLNNTWWVHVKFVFFVGVLSIGIMEISMNPFKLSWCNVVWHGESWLQKISDVRNYSKSTQQLTGQIIEQPHTTSP